MTPGDLVAYVAGVHERTRAAVAAIPPELLHSRAGPAKWSLAELVVHIANARPWNASGATGERVPYRGHDAQDESLASLLALLDDASAECLRKLEGAELFQGKAVTARGDRSTPSWERVLGGLVEHEAHHRGQLSARHRALGGDVPPLFGLFEEDLPRD